MTTEAVKSTVITNLDATPPVRGTSGAGGQGFVQESYVYVTPTNGVTTGSTYRMARVPSTATALDVVSEYSGTVTTFTGDVTLYYSDNPNDEVGAGQGDTGVVNSLSTTSAFFVHAHAWGSDTAGVPVNITNLNGKYNPDIRTQPLWQAAGLSNDPGGFFDIMIVETATVSVSSGKVAFRVRYCMPYSS